MLRIFSQQLNLQQKKEENQANPKKQSITMRHKMFLRQTSKKPRELVKEM